MTCTHCDRPMDLSLTNVRYPRSGAVAHVACVSWHVPSFEAMDALLAHRPTRRTRSRAR